MIAIGAALKTAVESTDTAAVFPAFIAALYTSHGTAFAAAKLTALDAAI